MFCCLPDFFFQIEIFDFSQFPDTFWFRFSALFVESWCSKKSDIPKILVFCLCVAACRNFFQNEIFDWTPLSIYNFGMCEKKLKLKCFGALASLGPPWPALRRLRVPPPKTPPLITSRNSVLEVRFNTFVSQKSEPGSRVRA